MGRKKIVIAPLQNDRNRGVTYLKRRTGLFKKAHELAVLTQSDVAVIVFGENGKLSEFCSRDIDQVLLRYTEYKGVVDRKGPADYEDDQNDDGDDNDGGGDDAGDGGGSYQSSNMGGSPSGSGTHSRRESDASAGAGNKRKRMSGGAGSGAGAMSASARRLSESRLVDKLSASASLYETIPSRGTIKAASRRGSAIVDKEAAVASSSSTSDPTKRTGGAGIKGEEGDPSSQQVPGGRAQWSTPRGNSYPQYIHHVMAPWPAYGAAGMMIPGAPSSHTPAVHPLPPGAYPSAQQRLHPHNPTMDPRTNPYGPMPGGVMHYPAGLPPPQPQGLSPGYQNFQSPVSASTSATASSRPGVVANDMAVRYSEGQTPAAQLALDTSSSGSGKDVLGIDNASQHESRTAFDDVVGSFLEASNPPNGDKPEGGTLAMVPGQMGNPASYQRRERTMSSNTSSSEFSHATPSLDNGSGGSLSTASTTTASPSNTASVIGVGPAYAQGNRKMMQRQAISGLAGQGQNHTSQHPSLQGQPQPQPLQQHPSSDVQEYVLHASDAAAGSLNGPAPLFDAAGGGGGGGSDSHLPAYHPHQVNAAEQPLLASYLRSMGSTALDIRQG